MPTNKEVHLAVGAPAGRRSTVWKFVIRKSDIYILTRMFGSDAKVSLHASGECQWSGTSNWVKKVPGRKNAERHFTKWVMPRPAGSEALHIFQVRIPETELRVIPLDEDLSSVQWLPTPPQGKTVSLECYITPPSAADPAIAATLPHPYLLSLQLDDGRWFVVLHHIAPLDGKDLDGLRAEMCKQARAAGIEPRPEYRASAFTVSDSTARGLIELCPVV